MKPLSKTRRTVSLVGLFLLFIIVVPFLLAYSSGYNFDFDKFTFVETGGVFIHSDLAGTRVFIDDEFIETNGVILRNTLVQGLSSDHSYRIRVEKDGYLPWYKELYVYPNLVTEGRIMMLPIEIPFERIAALLPTTERATTTKGLPNPEYEVALNLFATTTTEDDVLPEINTPFVDSLLATTTEETVLLPDYIEELGVPDIANKEQLQEVGRIVSWLEGGNIHVMWAGSYDATPFFFCDQRGCRDKVLVSLDTDIEQFMFFPGRNDVFIVQTENHIFAVEADDRSRQNLQTIYEGVSPEFRLVGNTIYILDGEELLRAEL